MKKTITFALPVRMLCMLMLAIALVFSACPNPSGGGGGDTYSLAVARISGQDSGYGTVAITTGAATGNASGATVKVTATAGSGYTFVKWVASDSINGTQKSTDAAYEFAISADTTLYAVFEGDGTNTPKNIASKAELEAIGTDSTTLGKKYKLMADITTPVTASISASAFTGTLDGNGHSIALNIVGSGVVSGIDTYAGLFGVLGSGAKVKNLSLTGTVTVTATDTAHVGALAGWSDAEVSAVRSSVAVTAASDDDKLYVGGLVGYQNSGAISNCYSTGAAQVPSTTTTTSGIYAGGIAGYQLSGTLSYCYATGNVSAGEASGESPTIFVGGITGYVYSALSNCSNCVALQSALSATGDGTKCVGRVFGLKSGSGSQSNNYARSGMTLTGGSVTEATHDGKDGANAPATLTQDWFTTSGNWNSAAWAFGSSEAAPWVWDSGSGKPKLWFE